MFLFGRYLISYFENEVKKDHSKIYPEDLNSPCQELSNGGLEIVVAVLARPGINFLCVSTGGPIQLYLQNPQQNTR